MFYNIEKGTGGPDGNPPFADYLENVNMVIMQFTGGVDKNGKDIYEGDTVIWEGGQYNIVFSSQDGSWILKDDREDWECPSLYGVSSPQQSRIEIIGNIYEGKKQMNNRLITWREMGIMDPTIRMGHR